MRRVNHVRDIVKANRVHSQNILGGGTCIAVLDSGICRHPDFDNRIIGWYDTISGRQFPYDDNGHGTHVTGIAAGSGLLSHGTYCGLAPKSKIVSVKVLDHLGEGMIQNILSGIEWVLAHKRQYGISIVNISVGTTGDTQFDENSLFVKKVNELWNAGIVVVASAGNKGPEPFSISAPGNSRKIITVGYHSRKSNSSIGPTYHCIKKPDVVTPGNQVISCSNLYASQNAYTKKSGTSMATPVVSGSIALLLSKYQEHKLSPKEVKIRLKNSCTDLNLPHNSQGWGLLNVEKLLS